MPRPWRIVLIVAINDQYYAECMTSGAMLRMARHQAGITQVELARRAGVTQSMISAYETDRREPAFSTLDRLLRATGHTLTVVPASSLSGDEPIESPTLRELRRKRRRIISLLERGGARHPRVFGSVARGTDTADDSDVDVMVDLDDDVSVVRLVGLQRQLSELLGLPVDLVPADALKPAVRERAMAESVEL